MTIAALELNERAGAVRFSVRAQPRSSRLEIAGVHGSALKVCIHAPPVDGAANGEIIEVISSALRIAKRDVQIVSGAAARNKIVEVHGLDLTAIRARLAAALA